MVCAAPIVPPSGGGSTTVSGRHYANDVPDGLFEKASAGGDAQRERASEGREGAKPQRQAQQKMHETAGMKKGPPAEPTTLIPVLSRTFRVIP